MKLKKKTQKIGKRSRTDKHGHNGSYHQRNRIVYKNEVDVVKRRLEFGTGVTIFWKKERIAAIKNDVQSLERRLETECRKENEDKQKGVR
jgi:hypothetical protein